MATDYRRNLPNNAYNAAVDANNPSSINPYATIDDLGANDGDTLLISGGASYSGTGLDFDVSILVYKITGIEYTTAATTVTLAAGDATFGRFDAIVASIDPTDNPIVEIVQGTPSANPITPALEANQVLVQYVFVGAGATTPTITTEYIYRNDGVSDWLGGFFGGFGTTANFTSGTPSPVAGAACCLSTFGRYGLLRGTRFTAPTPVDRFDYSILSFQVYLVDDLTANDITLFYVSAYSADPSTTGVYLGVIPLQNFIDFSLVGQWQLINVPTGLWAQNFTTATEIGFINFTVYKLQTPGSSVINPTVQVAFDEIKLQTGAPSSPATTTIDILEGNTLIGSTTRLSFNNGLNTEVTVIEDVVNSKVDVKYSVPDGTFYGLQNGKNVVQVTSAADLPNPLVANTTYVVQGIVDILSPITVNADNIEVVGLGRDSDGLNYTGTGAMFNITDSNFILKDLKLSGTNLNGSIINATNIGLVTDYNANRLKTMLISNCQFRNCYDVMDIVGYDLVDINNCLFFYIQALNYGLRFEDTSKIQITSCELIRWFDESSIPTPSGFATCSMIELQPTNIIGYGAVNINGCVIHPQQTQNGIEIAAGSTTGFGTISSNAFVNVGLSTGKLFLPEASGLPDYSTTQSLKYDVFANQGLLNSTSGTVMTLTGNTQNTALSSGVPVVIDTNGLAVQQAGVRFDVSTAGRATYRGSKQIYVSIHASISFEKQGGGVDDYKFYIYKNGAALPGAEVDILVDDDASTALPMVYGTLMSQNDYIEIYVENPTGGDDMLVKDFQIVIRE